MALPYRQSTRILNNLRRIPRPVISSKRAFSSQSSYREPYTLKRINLTRALDRRPKSHVEYIKIAPWDPIHPAYLRDSCKCAKCVDLSSKQKNFQTTDIPENIKAGSVITSTDGSVEITWENDIPQFGEHKSHFPKEFFHIHSTPLTLRRSRFQTGTPTLWNKKTITRELQYVNYDEYMKTDEGLFRAVRQLYTHGLLLVRDVPRLENSVENLALRIGNLRDTFYGRTWDVKNVPQAKNVAYTAKYLGLHMDLLYMSDPPGFQLLHCLQNTCSGGSSLFSDAFWAANTLPQKSFTRLSNMQLAYHYHNAGEHYYYQRPIIEAKKGVLGPSTAAVRKVNFVNYSPPFQANHITVGPAQQDTFPMILDAMREFASLVENEDNLFEYRLQEGECVIFNNRRVLHGRREFDSTAGSRWLKGAYIDTDVFMSKYRVLSEKFRGKWNEREGLKGKRLVNPDAGVAP